MRLEDLDAWATVHHGVITREHSGLSRSSWYRAIRAGHLRQLHPGVARLHGTPNGAVPNSTVWYSITLATSIGSFRSDGSRSRARTS